MAEYIEREAVLKTVKRMDGVGGMAVLCREDVEKAINNAPAADVAPVVHGRWVDKMVRDWHCSECGKKVPRQVYFDGYCYADKLNYCPNCGADMRGDGNG